MTNAVPANHLFESIAFGLKRVIHPVSRYLGYLSAVISLGMAAVIMVDLILRLGFNRPMSGIL